MKWSLRPLAFFLLLTTTLVTLARRDDSGWIAFEPVLSGQGDILLMTGDGRSQTRPANIDAILDRHGPPPRNDGLLQVINEEQGQGIIAVDADGVGRNRVPLDLSPGYISEPVWSPDGAWLAFLSGNDPAGEYIYRVRPDGRDLTRLTQRASDLFSLQWSPDGEWLLVLRFHQRFADIVRVRADGSALEVLTPGLYPQYAPASGLAWRPFWLTIVSMGLTFFSMMGRLRR